MLDGIAQLKQSGKLVDCIVTSPPYWGLRDYGIEGQIGLEEHPKDYIKKMVEVFHECQPILKEKGSLWLNLGDSYYSKSGSGKIYSNIDEEEVDVSEHRMNIRGKFNDGGWLQPKQKMLMPHRVAIALQDDGWILRNDIVWSKPNYMPSSVQDRLTNSFEYIFHFVKHQKYYYDLEAIRVPHALSSYERAKGDWKHSSRNEQMTNPGTDRRWNVKQLSYNFESGKNPGDTWKSWGGNENGEYFGEPKKDYEEAMAQNPSDVKRRILKSCNENGVHPIDTWTIPPQSYSDAHFATFPLELVRRPLLSTCPKQVCKKCGKPRERILKIEPLEERSQDGRTKDEKSGVPMVPEKGWQTKHETIGWTTCKCNAEYEPGIVLDPFAGSGTTLLEAQSQNKNGIGIEINPNYIPLIVKRLNGDANQSTLTNKINVVKK